MESDDIHSARFDQPKQLQEPENTNIKDEVEEINKKLPTKKDNIIHKTYQRIETTSQNSINDDLHYCITYGNDNKMQTNANQVDTSQSKQHHHCSLHFKDNSKSTNSTLNRQFSDKSLAYVELPEDKNLNIQTNNRRVFNISRNENKILICKPINTQGEPVKVNDRFLNNKLMLSCKPQNYSEFSVEEKYSYKDQYLSDCYDNSKQPEIVIPSQDSNDYRQRNNQAISKNAIQTYYKSKKRSDYHTNYNIKENDCESLYKKFTNCLWGLLVFSICLFLVGLGLALASLYYHLFREYLSIVIGESGFVTWMWIALFIALFILLVGGIGIKTSFNRSKSCIKTFLILAIILLATLMFVSIIFFVQYSSLKKESIFQSKRTFSLYRCIIRIRVAWDTMMETFRCCGKDGNTDWKYIPPTCCKATSKADKISCIGHFIQPFQAYSNGCNTSMLDFYYFLSIFFMILILIAIFFLVFGILHANRLLYMYSKILKCRKQFQRVSNM